MTRKDNVGGARGERKGREPSSSWRERSWGGVKKLGEKRRWGRRVGGRGAAVCDWIEFNWDVLEG